MSKIPIIVCTGTNGRAVVFGYVDKEPDVGDLVTIYDARMVLRWDEKCGGLFGLAANGPKGDTRLTAPVDYAKCQAVQVLSVSEKSAILIRDAEVWSG